MNNCIYITNDGIRNLATHCKKLKSLSMNGNFTLDLTSLKHLVDNGIDLTSLELDNFNVNNVMLDLISIGFPNLKKLIISNNREIDSSGIKHLEKLKKLEELNLSGNFLWNIVPGNIRALIIQLPNLKILNISMINESVCNFVEYPTRNDLEIICLQGSDIYDYHYGDYDSDFDSD